VAVLGYVDAAGRLENQFLPTLAAGLAWLGDRAWFRPHQPPTLEADGVAALGIALGVHRRGMIPQAGWLQELVVRSARSPDLSPLERSFFIVAAHLVDAPGRQDAAAMLPEARLVFAPLGFGAADDACCREAWQRTIRFAGSGDVVPEAALLLRALDVLTERNLPARLGQLDPRDVLHVLEGPNQRDSVFVRISRQSQNIKPEASQLASADQAICCRPYKGLCGQHRDKVKVVLQQKDNLDQGQTRMEPEVPSEPDGPVALLGRPSALCAGSFRRGPVSTRHMNLLLSTAGYVHS
jgi:hypothetical protein